MTYRLHTFLLPAEIEDDFVADLWAAGTLGVVSTSSVNAVNASSGAHQVRLEAYFHFHQAPVLDLAAWHARGVEVEEAVEIPATDWLARWREECQPFLVGERFLLDPREPGEGSPAEVPAGRRLLRLPARAAFGTGSHESTRLALELLEEAAVAGLRVLDVGTGTGVLAFAALALGATSAVGFDVDPASPVHARDNARFNGLFPRLFAGRAEALRGIPAFDLAVVNALPEEILPDLPLLVRLLRPGAQVILSGVLAERADEVLGRLAAFALRERARRVAGEWVGFRLGFHPAGGS